MKKWAKQHNKLYFSPQRKQNCVLKWIYDKTAYAQNNMFTPVLQCQQSRSTVHYISTGVQQYKSETVQQYIITALQHYSSTAA